MQKWYLLMPSMMIIGDGDNNNQMLNSLLAIELLWDSFCNWVISSSIYAGIGLWTMIFRVNSIRARSIKAHPRDSTPMQGNNSHLFISTLKAWETPTW
jgi:hypothetical protein